MDTKPAEWKELMLNGSIILFNKIDVLERIIGKVESEGFEAVRFDCGEWDEKLFHKEVARKLNFPAYYGKNLHAFSDCLSDLPINNTGISLVFTHYQDFLEKHPELALGILDVIHINSWRFLLEGKVLLSFIQSTDPKISLPSIGGMVPDWNREEWFDKDRGI